ncbi:MAG: potassium transporter TrkG, partial [Eubacteriales bacterium]|nr:potassium transporter TrkG [Eubacteriales bacterium]
GAIPNFIDAFFEMCSGYSTTGSTIIPDVESLPRSILFFRSLTHWIGGMGIIVFGTALLPSLGINGQLVANAETPGPTADKISARYSDHSKKLYLLYFAFTIAEIVLLFFAGMSPFDSMIHTFGTVGTGGFSSYNNSVAHFASPAIHWIIIIFMILCGTNFNLFFDIPKKGLKALTHDEEFRLYIKILGICTILITISLMLNGVIKNPFTSLTAAAFQTSSIMTTTGYATKDYDQWPAFAKCVLLIVFLSGACSSSTGGGPKIVRITVALKLIRRQVAKKLHPKRVYPLNYNGRPIPQEVATNISNFILFYIFVFFMGCLLVSLEGKDIVTTFSAVITCLGNIGPGFAKVGPTCNFSCMSYFSKFVLSILMIAGRLELFTVFVLFSPKYWNSNRG